MSEPRAQGGGTPVGGPSAPSGDVETPVRSGGEGSPIRVLLVGDVQLHRETLELRLALISSVSVVGSAEIGSKALRLSSALRPDVTLLDPAGGAECDAFVEALAAAAPSMRVIVVGAETTFSDVIAAIQAAAAPSGLVAPAPGGAPVELLATLTTRELEIVSLIELGLSNKEIAERLSISLTTVKNHVHHILRKLGLSRRGEAAALLRRTTLREARPGDPPARRVAGE